MPAKGQLPQGMRSVVNGNKLLAGFSARYGYGQWHKDKKETLAKNLPRIIVFMGKYEAVLFDNEVLILILFSWRVQLQ